MPGAVFDLHYVDELIAQRRALHGGYQGAPPVTNGYRQGESLNRSCILMLSALMQTYVEDVFVECSQQLMPKLKDDLEGYKNSFRRWGNPSPENVTQMFARLGVNKLLSGLQWQNTTEKTVAYKLRTMNELRNGIAHGRKVLILDKNEVTLSLSKVENYRNFCSAFASRFEAHAIRKVTTP